MEDEERVEGGGATAQEPEKEHQDELKDLDVRFSDSFPTFRLLFAPGFFHPKNLLLRTLRGLESEDLAKFKRFLSTQESSNISKSFLEMADVEQLLELLLFKTFYDVYLVLELTERALKAIGLLRQANGLHFARKGFHSVSCLIWALQHLTSEQAKRFRRELRSFCSRHRDSRSVSRAQSETPTAELLQRPEFWEQEQLTTLSSWLISYYGEDDGLEVAAEVLDGIGQEDWAACLRLCVEEHAALKRLEDALARLNEKDLVTFTRKLRRLSVRKGFEGIPDAWLKKRSSAQEISNLMLEYFGGHDALEMSEELLMDLGLSPPTRKDLALLPIKQAEQDGNQDPAGFFNPPLFESQSSFLGEKEPSEEMENPEDFVCSRCSIENFSERIRPDVVWDSQRKQDSYRFCSTEAGSFHCCYTDLIFVLKGAANITYQFDSWENHRSVKDAQNLIIAGPLLDIQADSLEAVVAIHFPHFLCLAGEDSSQVLIVHFVEEGMILEKPDSVGPFHAVLRNPTFSLFGVILKWSWLRPKFKVHAIALLYQELEIIVPKFHLYLLPNDSSIKKSVHKCEAECPSRRILKPPRIWKPLHIGSCFSLRDLEEVKICPKEIEFQYLDANREQQYLEIYAQHMKDELVLQLIEKEEDELVWEAYIRREELKSSTLKPAEATSPFVRPEEHFIERHQKQLIQRTTHMEAILDILLQDGILDDEQYQKISSMGTNQAKMRELYRLIPSWNIYCKDKFYLALKVKQSFLIDDLESK